MRDVISDFTLQQINAVLDEILVNLNDNVRNIEATTGLPNPNNLTTLAKAINYDGTVINIKGSVFYLYALAYGTEEEVNPVNINASNLVTVIGDKNGIKIYQVDTSDKHESYSNYLMNVLRNVNADGFKYYIHRAHGVGSGNNAICPFEISGLTVGASYTVSFTGKWNYVEYDTGTSKFCIGTTASDVSAQNYVVISDDLQAHDYSLTFTASATTMYLNFDMESINWDYEPPNGPIDEYVVSDLILSGMDISIVDAYISHEGTKIPIPLGGGGGGTSDLDAIELTYAEYQQLSSAEKLDPDKIYFITDYPASVGALNDLSDVDITTPTEGQILTYDDTDDEWKNTDVDDIAPTVTEASTRANIATGDTLKTIIGKIKKFFSDLKAVAFTGAYADLSGTPTIPTVNNGTLTIKRNNTSVGTFTANQSSASNINIECATPSDVEGSKTATGSIVTVTDAADIYAEEVDVAVECTQTGSGTPSPSNIRPIQGYDIVSVDRCGKNLFDKNDVVTNKVPDVTNNGRLTTQNGTDTTEHFIPLKPSTTYTISGNPRMRFWLYGVNGDYLDTYLQNAGQFTTNAQTYFIRISGNSGWQSNSIQIEENTSATTYEAYKGQHISLQLGNKNLLPMTVEGIKAENTSGTWSGNVYTKNNAVFTLNTDNGGNITFINMNGTPNADTTLYIPFQKGYGSVIANVGFTATGSDSTFCAAISINGGSAFSGRTRSMNSTEDTTPFNLDSESSTWYFCLGIKSGYQASNIKAYPMVRLASVTDPTFSPYNPTLGDMVYGGQLTLNDDGSAVFVGDRASKNIGELNFELYSADSTNHSFVVTTPSDAKPVANNGTLTEAISSSYEAKVFGNVSNFTQFNSAFAQVIEPNRFVVRDVNYTSASAFKTAMASQQIVYPLATPFTIHLSAEQLKLLQGTNNVWSNAGDVTLKYQPDNVIAEPKADVQRLRDDVDDRLVGNACRNLVFRTITGASINSSGTVVSNSAIDLQIAKVEQGVTYTATEDRTPTNNFVCGFFTEIPIVGSTTYNGGRYGETSPTFVAPISGYVAFWTYTGYLTPQLEIGSEQSPYEEYYPSNRELASLVDSSLVKCNPTTDYAAEGSKLDISAYADDKPIFGYVLLVKNTVKRYCPIWIMKNWGANDSSVTMVQITSYFDFTLAYYDSPRRVCLEAVYMPDGSSASSYDSITLYLYRNY